VRRLASALVAVVLAGAVVPLGSHEAPRVLLYGDSLMSEARTYVDDDFSRQGWDVDIAAFPGTGLCDWLPLMPSDAERVDPDLVLIALSGVIFSPCNQYDTGTGARCVEAGGTFDRCLLREWKAHWVDEARRIADLWERRGVEVLWVGALPEPGSVEPSPITRIYRGVAAAYDQEFVDAARSLRDRKGTWPVMLPCLRSETPAEGCVDERIQVRRSESNGHLCPIDLGDAVGPCPVYSSGIVRWGKEIASVTRRLLSKDVEREHDQVLGSSDGFNPVMS